MEGWLVVWMDGSYMDDIGHVMLLSMVLHCGPKDACFANRRIEKNISLTLINIGFR